MIESNGNMYMPVAPAYGYGNGGNYGGSSEDDGSYEHDVTNYLRSLKSRLLISSK